MAPERGICRVLAVTSQAVILCAIIHENTRGGGITML